MKPSSPVARRPKELSEEEKMDIITRKMGQVKASVSQQLLVSLSRGRGSLSARNASKIVDTALSMADEYIKKLYVTE